MAVNEFIVGGLGILIGVGLGTYVARRKINKIKRDIPEEYDKQIQKEVQESGKQESSQESYKEPKRRFRFFGRRKDKGREQPSGFARADGTNFRDGGREYKVSPSNIDPTGTESIGERPSVPIQSTSNNEGDKPIDPRPKGDIKKRSKRPRFNPI